MVLSDRNIQRRIANDSISIEPFEQTNVEPASVDLRLGDEAKLVRAKHNQGSEAVINVGEDDISDKFECDELTAPFVVPPGSFVLTTTLERVEIPTDVVAHVLGRSSLGRLGVSVHQTAGYIDPGFKGQITLELSNHGPCPVALEPGHRICQIVFEELSSPAVTPYGHSDSQYQNQTGATPSGMQFD